MVELIETFRGIDLRSKYTFPMITIFVKPDDFPGQYVARLVDLQQPTSLVALRDSLEAIRETIPLGWYCMGREPQDHPAVVETWF